MRWTGCLTAALLVGLCAGCGTGPYSAATVAKDTSAARAIVREIAGGQDTQAEALFDAKMAAGLSPTALGRSWQAVVAKYGAMAARGTPQASAAAGDLVVDIPLQLAHGSRVVRVVFDAGGQVAGLFFLP